jgi:tetratricopeptide (TPR) repeat protein
MSRRAFLFVFGLLPAILLLVAGALPCPAATAVEEPLLAILAKDPGNASALANLGRLAWRRGEKEKARDYFRSLVTARPELLLGPAGLALVSLDKPVAAEAALTSGGKEPGADQGIRDLTLALLAELTREALAAKGGANLAAAAAQRALAIAGDSPPLMTLAGQAFGAAGRHAEARDLLERAALLLPDDAPLLRLLDAERTALAVVKINRQEYADALDLLTLARDTTPPSPRLGALRALALYGLDRRADAAAAGIAAACAGAVPKELAGGLHAVLFNLGVLAQQEEREADALAAYEAAWAVNPTDAETGTLLATLLEKGGRSMEAVQVLQKVVAGHPDDAAAQTLFTDLSIRMYNEGAARGKAAWEQGNLKEALRYLTQALAIKPRDADAGYYLDKTVARLRQRLTTLRERSSPPWGPKDLPAVVADLTEALDLETSLAGLIDDQPWAGTLRLAALEARTAEGKRLASVAQQALREGRPAEAWEAATLVKALGEGADAATVASWIASAEKAIENLGKEPLARVQRAFDEGNGRAFADAVAQATLVIPREVTQGEKLYALIDEVDRQAHDALGKAEDHLLTGDFTRAGEQVAAALALKPGWEQAVRVREEIGRLGKSKIGDRLLARAKVYTDLGEFDLAGEILSEAKRVNPDDQRVTQALADLAAMTTRTTLADSLNAAELAARTGDLATARKRYEAILQRDPGNAEAAGGLAEIIQATVIQQADALWDQAQGKLLTRDYAGARTLLRRIGETNPGDVRVAEGLALVDAKERRDAGAAIAAVARSYFDHGNFADAEQTAREASTRFPESEEIAAMLSRATRARSDAAAGAILKAKEAAAAGEWRVAADILAHTRGADPGNELLASADEEIRRGATAEAEKLLTEASAELDRGAMTGAQTTLARALAIAPDSPRASALAARLAAAVPAVPPEKVAGAKAALAAGDLATALETTTSLRRTFPSDAAVLALSRDVATAASQAFRESAQRVESALASRDSQEAAELLVLLETALTFHPQGKETAERYRSRVGALATETEALARIRERMDGGRIEDAWKTCTQPGVASAGSAVSSACREVTATMTTRNRELFRLASAAFTQGDDAKARSILSGRFSQVNDEETETLARKVRERLDARIDGYLRAGREAIRRNDRNGAFLAATMALAVDPASQEAADLKRRSSPDDPAKAVAEKSRDLYFKGVTAYTSGDYQGAIRSWREVLLLEPTNEKARRNLDKANRRMGS